MNSCWLACGICHEGPERLGLGQQSPVANAIDAVAAAGCDLFEISDPGLHDDFIPQACRMDILDRVGADHPARPEGQVSFRWPTPGG